MAGQVTTELLDALLSPAASASAGQHSPRAQAERHLTTLSLPDRAGGLLHLLITLSSPASAGDAQNQPRALLAAVLLRRDIAVLGGNAHSATGLDNATAMNMLREMVGPLLQLFLSDGSGSSGKATRRQVGHCLAELCLSCSVLGGEDSSGNTIAAEVMAQVLTGIGPGVSLSCDVICHVQVLEYACINQLCNVSRREYMWRLR